MITAAIVTLSPEMIKALDLHKDQDESVRMAYGSFDYADFDQAQLTVTAEMAVDWCESWFSADELKDYCVGGENDGPEFPAMCDNQLIHDFVQTILKIYRLTQSV